jgi:hypothetical protein
MTLIEAGPDPGHRWEVLDMTATLDAVPTSAVTDTHRYLASLQVGFTGEPLVEVADLNDYDVRQDPRVLSHQTGQGLAQINDPSSGVGAGGSPIRLRYTEPMAYGELSIPYPGELLVGTAVRNDVGAGATNIELMLSLELVYQVSEEEDVPPHGVPVR